MNRKANMEIVPLSFKDNKCKEIAFNNKKKNSIHVFIVDFFYEFLSEQ